MTESPATDPKRAKFSLDEQAEEANRILTQRYKTCEARAKSGDMTREAADRDIAIARAIRDTLRLFAEYPDDVRAALMHARKRRKDLAEIERLRAELAQNPAVQAVREHFPEAEILLPAEDEFA